MNIRLLAVIGALGALSLSSFASAQSGSGQPPKPPFAAIAKQLGISEATVKSCFPKKPSGGGQQSSDRGQQGSRPERPDMSSVGPCLRKANGSLTEAQIKQVMQDNRPKR